MTEQPHTQRAHARLAPSSAHRWMHCPGSIRASDGIPEKSSVFAAEGTAAHELCSHCLTNKLDAGQFLGVVIDIEASGPGAMFSNKPPADGKTRFEVDEEMVDAVQVYLDTVRAHQVGEHETEVEQRLDMTHVHPEIFGTGDATVYAGGHLHVFDFKYGKGVVVDPTDNPQLLLYGAGAVRRHHNRPLSAMTLHVVQPRAGGNPVKSWETDIVDLLEWEGTLRAAALATEADDAPLAAGDWCRFCPAKPVCPTMREKVMNLAEAEFGSDGEGEISHLADPSSLPGEKVAALLRNASLIKDWFRAVEEFAHAEASDGRCPPGFKLVAKRPSRKWKDEEAALKYLRAYGMEDADLHVDPKMKSPAQVEKTVGRKNASDIEHLWVKESSGTNLVPDEDPRPPSKADAESEFANTEG